MDLIYCLETQHKASQYWKVRKNSTDEHRSVFHQSFETRPAQNFWPVLFLLLGKGLNLAPRIAYKN